MVAATTRLGVEKNLESIGMRLPERSPTPRGLYSVVRVYSDLAQTSALGPLDISSGDFSHVGEIGTNLEETEGAAAAAVVAINLIAALDEEPGLERISKLIEMVAYIQANPEFRNHAAIANGASEVLLTAFGAEVGAHARTVVGVQSLPFGLPIVASLRVQLTGLTR